MKKVFLIISCVLLSGCSIKYNIDFNQEQIEETITSTFNEDITKKEEIEGDGFYPESEIVYNEIPAVKLSDKYYKKDFKVGNNKTIATLTYNYGYDEFKDAYLINKCFENVSIINEKEYLYVDLGGQFLCFYNEDIDVTLTTEYEVIKHNADSVSDDNMYHWNIKQNNTNQNISFQLSKNINKKSTKRISLGKTLTILFFSITALGMFLVYRYKK